MHASLIFDQGNEVNVPESMGKAREDQLKGTPAEQLMEVAGRLCYQSLGSGRGSGEYHKNLLFTQKHYSVAEHVHFTIEADLSEQAWLGIPDTSIRVVNGLTRATVNLRHVLEWPGNVTFENNQFEDFQEVIDKWKNVLTWAAWEKCPNVFPKPEISCSPDFKFVKPERDTEAFVSLFLEDSLVCFAEMNRHRGNISQRSGRFCDQTDRKFCIHPYLQEYLNEIGYLSAGQEDGPNIFTGGTLEAREAGERVVFGSLLGQHIAQGQVLYTAAADRLQEWIKRTKNVDSLTARKQARSAARFYLGQGLSSEMCYTASIRHWRHIFNMRISPAADAAIHSLMEQAYILVKESRWGHLL